MKRSRPISSEKKPPQKKAKIILQEANGKEVLGADSNFDLQKEIKQPSLISNVKENDTTLEKNILDFYNGMYG